MKVSLNWLKDYLDVSGTAEEISDTLTALGLEASYEITGKSFTGIVLGKVIECGSMKMQINYLYVRWILEMKKITL